MRQLVHHGDPKGERMPLKPGQSKQAIAKNIRKLIREGYTPKQAAAIAYDETRKRKAR